MSLIELFHTIVLPLTDKPKTNKDKREKLLIIFITLQAALTSGYRCVYSTDLQINPHANSTGMLLLFIYCSTVYASDLRFEKTEFK